MCSGSFKRRRKRTLKNGKNWLFSQAKNVSGYVRYHIKTSTHSKFGCSTQNLQNKKIGQSSFRSDIANTAEAL